jgi:hypothetical protein
MSQIWPFGSAGRWGTTLGISFKARATERNGCALRQYNYTFWPRPPTPQAQLHTPFNSLVFSHHHHSFFFWNNSRSSACLSIKTNGVYVQERVAKRGAYHHERLTHPRDAAEYNTNVRPYDARQTGRTTVVLTTIIVVWSGAASPPPVVQPGSKTTVGSGDMAFGKKGEGCYWPPDSWGCFLTLS